MTPPPGKAEVRAALDAALRRHAARKARGPVASTRDAVADPAMTRHASHGTFSVSRAGGETSACLIEPTVVCTHCGFCLSLGH